MGAPFVIDPDVAAPQFLGQRHRERIDRPLGRRIERRVRYRILAGDRADIDDTAAADREVLQRFLDRQDWPKDVGVECVMALLLRHGLERLALQNSRIVHQHIYGAEDVRRFFAHALHIGRPGDLSLEYDRLATMAGHLRHGAPRSLCV